MPPQNFNNPHRILLDMVGRCGKFPIMDDKDKTRLTFEDGFMFGLGFCLAVTCYLVVIAFFVVWFIGYKYGKVL